MRRPYFFLALLFSVHCGPPPVPEECGAETLEVLSIAIEGDLPEYGSQGGAHVFPEVSVRGLDDGGLLRVGLISSFNSEEYASIEYRARDLARDATDPCLLSTPRRRFVISDTVGSSDILIMRATAIKSTGEETSLDQILCLDGRPDAGFEACEVIRTLDVRYGSPVLEDGPFPFREDDEPITLQVVIDPYRSGETLSITLGGDLLPQPEITRIDESPFDDVAPVGEASFELVIGGPETLDLMFQLDPPDNAYDPTTRLTKRLQLQPYPTPCDDVRPVCENFFGSELRRMDGGPTEDVGVITPDVLQSLQLLVPEFAFLGGDTELHMSCGLATRSSGDPEPVQVDWARIEPIESFADFRVFPIDVLDPAMRVGPPTRPEFPELLCLITLREEGRIITRLPILGFELTTPEP